jgi:PKD repeat protein
MKLNFNVLWFIIMLTLIPCRQQLTAQEKSASVEIDLHEYASFGYRFGLVKTFLEDSDLIVMPHPEGNGIIQLKSRKDLTNEELQSLIDDKQRQVLEIVEAMDKQSLAEAEQLWKQAIGNDWIDFVLADQKNLRGDFCAESDPFCTGEIYSFPAGVNNGSAEPGPDYGCLSSQPNPVWYHMRILQAGDITIEMVGTRTNGDNLDIDFAIWGPYSDPVTPCPNGLTANCTTCPSNTSNPNFYPSGNLHDCSYSASNVEHAHIVDGEVGQYFILLITNYANAAGNITFQKTAGDGETDCSILPPPIGSNSPVCVGETLQLYADNVAGASYSWTGPNGFTSNQQNPVINNVTMAAAGTYSLVITVGASQSDPIELEVVVNPMPIPDFSFTEACRGEETIFTDLSTVNPISGQITSWHWAFGDGSESSLQNPTHLYASAGTYQVTLTTYTGESQCAQDITKQVLVKMSTDVDAGEDQTIFNGWTTQLAGSATAGSGNYTILWQPSGLVENPDELQTGTLPLTTTTIFTLSVTDNSGGCMSEDQVVITVTGNPFVLNVTADDYNLCPEESTQLHALPAGGSGSYTYSWTSDPVGFSSNIASPIVSPTQTTTYFVAVFDGQNTLEGEVTVEVGPISIAHAGPDQTITTGWTTQLEGSVEGGSGNYIVDWQPESLLETNNTLTPTTLPLENTTVFTLSITDNLSGCMTEDQVTIFTTGGILSVTANANPETICQGGSSLLNATASGGSGNYSYLWTTVPPSSWQATTAQVSVSPDETTTYQVNLSDGQNNVTDQITISVGLVTVANAGTDITIPAGTTATLQGSTSGGSGSFEVSWTPAALLNNPTILQPTTIPLDETKHFTLLITDNSSGFESSDQMSVIVSGTVMTINPTANPEEICPGEQSQLSANASGGSGSYTYEWTSNPAGFTSNEANPVVSPEVTTAYHVLVDDGTTQLEQSVTVYVGALSVADAGPDKTINYGWTTVLEGSITGDPDYTFSWSPAGFLQNPESLTPTTISMEQNKSFTLEVTNQNSGCSTSDVVQVNITGGPLGVEIAASANVICSGTQVQLTANPFGGSGNYTYSWSSSNGNFSSNLPDPVVEPMISTTYTVIVNDGMNSVSDQQTITVNPSPVASAGTNQVINVGTFTTLLGSASGGTGNFSYQWSPADSLANPATGQYMPQPQTKILYNTTNFNLLVTDLNGCVDESGTTVIVGGDQLGVFVETSQSSICLGESTQLFTTAFGGGSSDYTYSWTVNNDSWQSSEANPVVSPSSTSIYEVEVSDGFTSATASITIAVLQLPEVDIVPAGYTETDNTIFVCVRDSVWLDAGPNLNYYWMNGATSQRQKAVTNGNWIDVQNWWVRVTNPETGCQNRDDLTVFFDFNTCNIGLSEWNHENNLQIFPNPTKGLFNITFKHLESTANLWVLNPAGQILIRQELEIYYDSNNQHQLDLSMFPSGIYYLMLTDRKEKIVKKLIRL